MTPGEKQRHDQQLSTLKHGLEQCTARRNELGRELQAVTKVNAEVRLRLKESVAKLAQHVDALSAGRAVEQGLREEIARLAGELEQAREERRVALETVEMLTSETQEWMGLSEAAENRLSEERQKNTLLTEALRGAPHTPFCLAVTVFEGPYPTHRSALPQTVRPRQPPDDALCNCWKAAALPPSEALSGGSDKALLCNRCARVGCKGCSGERDDSPAKVAP